jgi:putative salt-induced outer membrane protein YdiY
LSDFFWACWLAIVLESFNLDIPSIHTLYRGVFMKVVKNTFFAATLILCLMIGLYAQEERKEENKWGGDAAVGLALARGNTDTTNISLTFSTKGPLSKFIDCTNKAFFLLNKEKDITNAESMGLESQIQWKHSARFFSYYGIQGLRDRFKNYNYRILPGLGLGYKILSTENFQLSANTGLSQVFTKYYAPEETDSFTGMTLGNEFTWKVSQSAKISQTLSFNTNISELGHIFLQFEISLASAITNGLSVKLTLMDKYDSKPVGEGIKKNDISFIAGLSAKF